MDQISRGNRAAFWLLALAYIAAFIPFIFIESYRRQIADGFQASLNGDLYILSFFLLLLAGAIYFLAYRLRAGYFSIAFIFFCLVSLALSFLWPLTSSDLFSYVSQARVWAIHGLDPYVVPYQLIEDAFFDTLKNIWSFKVSPYGPVFMLVSSLAIKVFQNSFWWTIFGLKFLFVSLNIITAYLIYRYKRDYLSFFLFAFNPLILFEIAINGHNDAMFTFFLVAAVILFTRPSLRSWSYVMLSLSVLTKYYSLILLPLWLIIGWREADPGTKLRQVSFSLAAFAIPFLSFLPFMQNVGVNFVSQTELIGFFLSPLISIINGAFSFVTPAHLDIAIWTSRVVFLVAYLWLLILAIRKGSSDNFLLSSTLAIVFLLLTAFTWLMPWYFVSVIALFCLLHSQPRHRSLALKGIVAFSAYGILHYLILR